jgi:protein involved in polysaccharide export with SLBB domain
MRRGVLMGAVLVLVLAAPALAGAQEITGDEPLRPGDLVRLRVWGDTTFQGDFPVDERGHVVLPRLGSRDVGSLSPQSLRDQVVAEYQRMLRDPAVEVLAFRRVLVLGSVSQPGTHFLWTSHRTLSDAIGAAGGVTAEGRQDRVWMTRAGETTEHRLGQGLQPSEFMLRSGDQVFVPQRPWIARNQAVVATLISSAVSVLVTVLLVTGSD